MWDAGDLEGAEAVLRGACETLAAGRDAFGVATLQALRAWLLLRLGRLDEATALIESSSWAWAIPMAQVYWARARGLALAQQGDPEQAVGLALQAIAMLEGSGDLHSLGDEHENLGRIHELAGDHEAARESFEQARGFFGEKGCAVCVRRLSATLAAI
jgi:tetratricopeptide (TPR) repeat protein